MSDDSKNGISLSTIHELMLDQRDGIAEMRGEIRSHTAELKTIREAQQQHGIQVAKITSACAFHVDRTAGIEGRLSRAEKKLSGINRAVSVDEDTGVTRIPEIEKEKAIEAAKWRVLKYLGAGLVAVIGIAQAVFSILKGV